MSNCKQRYHVVRYICCLLLITNNHTWQCYESNYCLFSFTTMLCAQVCCWLLCSYGVLFEVSIVGQKQLSPHNAQFQPNHTIVVTKHFRTLTSSFTEIHELGKYQFSKEKFPHSFSLLLSVSFFYPRHRGRGGRDVCCAREISGTAMSFRTWNCATTEWPTILLLLRCTAASRHECSHVTGLRIG